MAGSWAQTTSNIGSNGLFKISRTFTADASDGSIPAWPTTGDDYISNLSGCIQAVEVIFGSPAPNALVVSLKTPGGLTLPGFPAASLSASGWALEFDEQNPIAITGGISGTFTTNTTNSAKATINIYGFGWNK